MAKPYLMLGQETNFESNHLSPNPADRVRQWFAVSTLPRHEKRAYDLLTERGIESFLPLYHAVRQWKKSAAGVLALPLFPTYMFVRILRHERAKVLSIPGVLSIVGSQYDPWPLQDSDVETLRLGIQARSVAPHPYVRCGERVRINTGVLSGVEGILVRKKNEYRVIITLDTIMRSVSIEVDRDHIEAFSDVAPDPSGQRTIA